MANVLMILWAIIASYFAVQSTRELRSQEAELHDWREGHRTRTGAPSLPPIVPAPSLPATLESGSSGGRIPGVPASGGTPPPADTPRTPAAHPATGRPTPPDDSKPMGSGRLAPSKDGGEKK